MRFPDAEAIAMILLVSASAFITFLAIAAFGFIFVDCEFRSG